MRIEGLASTDSLDLQHEVILHSAYLKPLLAFRNSSLPLLQLHRKDLPAVGVIEQMMLTDQGLRIVAWVTNERVKHYIRLGVLRSFSVGFKREQATKSSETGVGYIQALNLREISICEAPVNPDAKFTISSNQCPYFSGPRALVSVEYVEKRAEALRVNLGIKTLKRTIAEFDQMTALLVSPLPIRGHVAALRAAIKVVSAESSRLWCEALDAAAVSERGTPIMSKKGIGN